MMRVAIVDYGMGNLDSVARAVTLCGGAASVVTSGDQLAEVDRIILPGVGAFPDGMANLVARGLREPLLAQVASGTPLLGICLGMQLLADSSEEAGGADGLGLVGGRVVRLEPVAGERVPHVGWNEVHPTAAGVALLAGIAPGKDFYFVHSYHLAGVPNEAVLARTPYCGGFASIVGAGRVFGVQFHPEKSRPVGFRLLRNFLAAEIMAPC